MTRSRYEARRRQQEATRATEEERRAQEDRDEDRLEAIRSGTCVCVCGCGQKTEDGKRYLHGHAFFNQERAEEAK